MSLPPGRPRDRAPLLLGPAVVAALLLAGCSTTGEQDVRASAERFAREAVSSPAQACGLVASATLDQLEQDGEKCSDVVGSAVPSDLGAVRAVSLAGSSAQVRFEGDTLFLSRDDEGWRVLAAGCRRTSSDPDEPYACELAAG